MAKSTVTQKGVPDSACLSLDALHAILKGGGTVAERDHLQHCPFCSDAVEGLATTDGRLSEAMADLTSRLEARTVQATAPARNWRMLAVAAAIVLLMFIPAYQMFSGPDPQDVFQEHFVPFHNTIPVTRDTSAMTPLQEVMAHYEARNFPHAVEGLQELLRGQPENQLIRFYAGVSCLANGQAEQALTTFAPLTTTERGQWFAAAQWYSALAYLKLGETSAALTCLQKIQSDEVYGERSSAVIEILD